LLLDGRTTSGRFQLDPAGVTSRGGRRDLTFKHWIKSRDGHQVKHAFTFSSRKSADGDDDDDDDDATMSTKFVRKLFLT
ncbi:MAG: hypothetical protein VXY93_20645, partial [Pseudomonadota bacterium]|nr:hypothetical protein [Pseudomonadota bacterium]